MFRFTTMLVLAAAIACQSEAMAQTGPIQETASAAATSLDAKPATSSPSEQSPNKGISKADREIAQRAYKAGVKYLKGKLTRQAMQSFQQAVSYDPDYADAHTALGQTYLELGQPEDAVVSLEKAIKLNPNAAGTYTLLGQAYTKLKEKGIEPPKPASAATETKTFSVTPEAPPVEKSLPEGDQTRIYYVGVADILDIRMSDSVAKETTLFTIAETGHIDHPILSRPVKVAGLTTEQIASLFSAELKRRSLNDTPPDVTVREYNSHMIMVSGLVKDPGTKVLRREAIPLYVVLADAQLMNEAALVDVMSQTTSALRTIDLSAPDQTTILIKPGDVVTVRAAAKRFFYMGGNVKAPGELPYRTGLTLTQAILSAGGVVLKGERVQLTRGQGNGLLTTQEFKLKEINSGKSPDPLIEPGDRINVLP